MPTNKNNTVQQRAKTPKQSRNTKKNTSSQPKSQNLTAVLQRAYAQPEALTANDWRVVQSTIGNRRTQNLMQRQTVNNVPKVRVNSTAVQRFAFDDDPTTWDSIDEVTRSGDGVKGVFFFEKDGTRLVVKPSTSDASEIDFANRFNQSMGLDAPDMKIYTKGSAQGQKLAQILLANKGVGKTDSEVEDQVNGATHFTVMGLVAGSGIHRLGADGANQFLNDSNAMISVGRLMVIDTFMGNRDRLIGARVNLGNFFYDVENSVVRTIDNDSKFESVLWNNSGTKLKQGKALDMSVFTLESLLDTSQRGGRYAMIGSFITRLKLYYADLFSGDLPEVDEDFIHERIGLGIEAGLSELDLLLAGGESTYIEEIKEKYGNSAYTGVKGFAKYLRARLRGKSKNETNAQFLQYLKYRETRENVWSGFKWTTKKFVSKGLANEY